MKYIVCVLTPLFDIPNVEAESEEAAIEKAVKTIQTAADIGVFDLAEPYKIIALKMEE